MRVRKSATTRLIETDDDVRTAIRSLRRKCPTMRLVHDLAGDPPLRRMPAGFLGLSRSVVFQQVSTASGNAIWSRVEAGIAPFDAPTLLQKSDDELRGFGLSRPKVRTLRAIAAAVADGSIDFDALPRMPDDEVREALVGLHGIGPWTADIYLMFGLGRPDTFAPGDLALQEAARLAMSLDERPSAYELAEIAARWKPWRAVAARLLWAYYRVAKEGRSGAPV
jgi:DNA-3-methyladenine glycosylase II